MAGNRRRLASRAVSCRAISRSSRRVCAALAAERALARRERAVLADVEQAVAARRLAEEQYRRGLVDIVTVLESQRRVFDARRALLELQNLRLQNRIDLYLALGGEFAQPAAHDQ